MCNLICTPLITEQKKDGVIQQRMGISGMTFFSVDGKKFYSSYDGAAKSKPNTVVLINNVHYAFQQLANKCEFNQGFICHHHKCQIIGVSYKLCRLKNCPLLEKI